MRLTTKGLELGLRLPVSATSIDLLRSSQLCWSSLSTASPVLSKLLVLTRLNIFFIFCCQQCCCCLKLIRSGTHPVRLWSTGELIRVALARLYQAGKVQYSRCDVGETASKLTAACSKCLLFSISRAASSGQSENSIDSKLVYVMQNRQCPVCNQYAAVRLVAMQTFPWSGV